MNFKIRYCLFLYYIYSCLKAAINWNIVSSKSSCTKQKGWTARKGFLNSKFCLFYCSFWYGEVLWKRKLNPSLSSPVPFHHWPPAEKYLSPTFATQPSVGCKLGKETKKIIKPVLRRTAWTAGELILQMFTPGSPVGSSHRKEWGKVKHKPHPPHWRVERFSTPKMPQIYSKFEPPNLVSSAESQLNALLIIYFAL